MTVNEAYFYISVSDDIVAGDYCSLQLSSIVISAAAAEVLVILVLSDTLVALRS